LNIAGLLIQATMIDKQSDCLQNSRMQKTNLGCKQRFSWRPHRDNNYIYICFSKYFANFWLFCKKWSMCGYTNI